MESVLKKRTTLVKQADRFGTQFPVRLLGESLSFLGTGELVGSQSVCSGWKLSPSLLNRAWERLYAQNWEARSGERKEIAVDGVATPWLQRYKRRKQTEDNWRYGLFRRVRTRYTGHTRCTTRVGENLLAIGAAVEGTITLLDVHTNSVVKAVDSAIAPFSLAHHDNLLLSGVGHGEIKSWLLPDLIFQRDYQGLNNPVTLLATNGKLLVGGDHINLIIWAAATGESHSVLSLQGRPTGLDVDWTTGTAYVCLVLGNNEKIIQAISLGTGHVLRQVSIDQYGAGYRSVLFRPDHGDLLIASNYVGGLIRQVSIPELRLQEYKVDKWHWSTLEVRSSAARAAHVGWHAGQKQITLQSPKTLLDIGSWALPKRPRQLAATVTKLFLFEVPSGLTVLDFSPCF